LGKQRGGLTGGALYAVHNDASPSCPVACSGHPPSRRSSQSASSGPSRVWQLPHLHSHCPFCKSEPLQAWPRTRLCKSEPLQAWPRARFCKQSHCKHGHGPASGLLLYPGHFAAIAAFVTWPKVPRAVRQSEGQKTRSRRAKVPQAVRQSKG
jgi:hypothetical protein